MPIYEYRCEQGHNFDVRQSMSDDPVATCVTCGASVQRVFRPPAVHFKGSGFYNTDYGKQRRGRSTEEGGDSGSDGAKSDEGQKASDGKAGESKGSGDSGSKAGSASGSSSSSGSSPSSSS